MLLHPLPRYNHGTPDTKWRFNLFPGYMTRYSQSLVKEAVGEYEKVRRGEAHAI